VVAALQLALTFEKNLNEIWGAASQRRLVRRVIVYWSMLTLGPVLIGMSIYLARQVGVTSGIQELAVSVAGPLFVLYLVYQLMPSASVHWWSALAGAFTAALLLQVASVLFGLYLTHAVGYEKLYGNLGLVPIFLFWIWINWVIVLCGAEVAYTIQNLERLAAEERRRYGRPFIQPGLVALGLVLHAARAFRGGKGPVDADELAEASDVPDKLWLRLVDLLRSRGVLVETGPEGSRYIPGRPLEAIRVEEVFAAVDDELVARPDENWHPEHQQLKHLTDLLRQSRQRELGQTSIANLLEMEASRAAPVSTSAAET
jgi:membrane protein